MCSLSRQSAFSKCFQLQEGNKIIFLLFLVFFCFKYIVFENVGDREANNTLFAITYHETLSFSFIFVGGNLSFCKFCQKSFL